MPAVFANLATSRYWHISSSKIAQLRLNKPIDGIFILIPEKENTNNE
jgi:hypothetical protein